MSIQPVSGNASSGTGTSGSNSAHNAMGNLDATFLNLLITELKSQDPTAPMDSTQMVGQMVSLNQLDQLIGIHQILQANGGATVATGTPAITKGGN